MINNLRASKGVGMRATGGSKVAGMDSKDPQSQSKPDVNGTADSKAADGSADDQKKKAKVKDFYSNLLNKKKTDKLATPKNSGSGAAGGAQAPAAN